MLVKLCKLESQISKSKGMGTEGTARQEKGQCGDREGTLPLCQLTFHMCGEHPSSMAKPNPTHSGSRMVKVLESTFL